MSVLLLRLAAPMQAWGASSRFAHRHTRTEPTKSGVLGMLAAARGIRRTEPLTELLGLNFGVRIDQPGQLMRDFQVSLTLDRTKPMPLSYRYYLADAVFLAAVEGDPALVTGLDEALANPRFPLYLGRRSCPPAGQVSLGVHDGPLAEALAAAPWQASRWYQRKAAPTVRLDVVRDAAPHEDVTETVRDVPITFDPVHRQHTWRAVVRTQTEVANPHSAATQSHEPMALLGG